MKKNLIFTLMIIFLCCGCTVSYTIEIDENLGVKESAKALEDAEFFNQYTNSSVERIIGFLLEPNLDYLNENKFVVDYIKNEEEAGVNISNSYSSIEEYIKTSKLYEQYGEKLEYIEEDNKITLKIKGEFLDEEQVQSEKYLIDSGEISIVLPNRTVIEHNADVVDEENNKYTWNLEDSDDVRELYITFNKKVNSEFPLVEVIAIVAFVSVMIASYFIWKLIAKRKDSVDKI